MVDKTMINNTTQKDAIYIDKQEARFDITDTELRWGMSSWVWHHVVREMLYDKTRAK